MASDAASGTTAADTTTTTTTTSSCSAFGTQLVGFRRQSSNIQTRHSHHYRTTGAHLVRVKFCVFRTTVCASDLGRTVPM